MSTETPEERRERIAREIAAYSQSSYEEPVSEETNRREARRVVAREWRRNNKAKVRASQRRGYWRKRGLPVPDARCETGRPRIDPGAYDPHTQE